MPLWLASIGCISYMLKQNAKAHRRMMKLQSNDTGLRGTTTESSHHA
ncbi:hypothetical protein EYZ11_006931 [Aspergillus tanneri]|uniref:Uncharacterized protein n=1 Tax=Aspergillus tanneri TaxID=1220188 RepID=A0A4S3JGM9_9EURO|nr:hypothetical protein EYZ11_006931 [Aspergillus tanneri]